jgi:hypothetical protein
MRHSKLVASSLLAFAFACAGTSTTVDPFTDLTVRAQGTIALGATHAPGSSTVTPSVSISFIPDTTTILTSCGETTTDTCVVTQAPDCTSLSCATGDSCGWDASCNATCVAPCTLTCPSDQQCTIAGDGSSSCQPTQTFDAGPIAISGTTMSVAVYPPYAWKAADDGSPFAPGADLHAQATGPTDAGFSSFNIDFHATTFLEASPSLDQLALSDVFGSSDLTLGWVPGSDRVYVLATGAGASARCLAQDASGTFTLPRSVISQVLGSQGVNALTLSLERLRLERHQDLKTVGSLATATVQSKAWLDLITTSTESIALQACQTSQTSCGSKCVDTQTDADNCGSCGNSCNGKACVGGMCQTSTGNSCTTCQASADGATCSSSYTSCTGDCKSLLTCAMACNGDTTCQSNCLSQYPDGESAFEDYFTCLCDTACSSECSTQCGGQ